MGVSLLIEYIKNLLPPRTKIDIIKINFN